MSGGETGSTGDETPLIVQEVAPRDGLQIEPAFVDTADKVALIDALSATGFSRIEATSFVSPRAVPALRDAAEVLARITRRPGTLYVALVPNLKGAERALAARADELNLVMSASETHNRANMGLTREASLDGFARIVAAARG
ncbi:MAG: hydroxymethylglutaryl-CoA lyase, partial [Methylobacterium sp.]